MAENKRFDKKNFRTRTISAVVFTALLLGISYLGGWFFFALSVFVGMNGLWEFNRLFGQEKTPEGIVSYAAAALWFAALGFGKEELLLPAVFLAFLTEMAVYVFRFGKSDWKSAVMPFAGVIYTVCLFSCLWRVRMLPGGICLIWLVFLISWGSDLFAYLVGVCIGKHKMAPVLSPKKSVEGLGGGILGAALLGFLYALFFGETVAFLPSPKLLLPVLCAVASPISVIGDLAASAFKRNMGIKDYSNLIPGHGGILDRFDSVIFVAPVVYYLLKIWL